MPRNRREGGVTVVEAAFALPILFMFMFGLIDLGMWSYNVNQATNAARDGARAGIIDYRNADVEGSATHDAIVEAVEARLPGREADNVDVSCVDTAGDPVPGGCVDAFLDTDRIRVEVDWTWNIVTPIANVLGIEEGAAEGVAMMTIVGRPVWGTPVPSTTTTAPPTTTPPTTEPPPDDLECEISGLTVNPSTVQADKHGRVGTITITYTTNGAERCNGLAVQLTTPSPGQKVVSAICDACDQTNLNHEWQYVGPEGNEGKIWDHGGATARVYNTYADEATNFLVNRSSS